MNAHVTDDAIAWIDVGAVTDVPIRGARRVPTPRGDIAIFRTGDGQVFALKDACPHKGGPLSQGIVFGTHVACPLHNWTIGLCDGQASAPDEGCTPKFSVKVENGQVYLDAHELATHGTDLERPIAGPARRVTVPDPACRQGRRGSNSQPLVLETSALPVELRPCGEGGGPGRAPSSRNQSRIFVTTPEPTVLPPSRIANRTPSSMAIGTISSTSILTLSPGDTISTPPSSFVEPVTSVVRK